MSDRVADVLAGRRAGNRVTAIHVVAHDELPRRIELLHAALTNDEDVRRIAAYSLRKLGPEARSLLTALSAESSPFGATARDALDGAGYPARAARAPRRSSSPTFDLNTNAGRVRSTITGMIDSAARHEIAIASGMSVPKRRRPK